VTRKLSKERVASTFRRAALTPQQAAEQLHIPLATIEGLLSGVMPGADAFGRITELLDKRLGGELEADPEALFEPREVHRPATGRGMAEALEHVRLQDAIKATEATIARLVFDLPAGRPVPG
jgi:hypothetical protein